MTANQAIKTARNCWTIPAIACTVLSIIKTFPSNRCHNNMPWNYSHTHIKQQCYIYHSNQLDAPHQSIILLVALFQAIGHTKQAMSDFTVYPVAALTCCDVCVDWLLAIHLTAADITPISVLYHSNQMLTLHVNNAEITARNISQHEKPVFTVQYTSPSNSLYYTRIVGSAPSNFHRIWP
jgi:hypothetical protein